MTEQEKMLSGKIYDPSDAIRSTLRVKAHKFSQQYNNTFEDQIAVRKQILEYGKPVTIGANCWIASNVVITGGVTIGEGCVIGAGSVVTRDISPNSLAVGNPCRVIREITEEDSVKYRKELF